MRKTMHFGSLLVGAALLGGMSMPIWAVDGVILIDQNKAMAGNVTPGDAPGFPVTISLPGSYRLAGNLTVPDANTTAILIAAKNVSIDLNGFTIQGPTVCSFLVGCSPIGTGHGIDAGLQLNTAVTNGTVSGMGSDGVVLGLYSRVDKVQANNNGRRGISAPIGAAVVTGNIATSNGSNGIVAGGNSNVVSGNIGSVNGGADIVVGCPSVVFSNFGIFLVGSGCADAVNASF